MKKLAISLVIGASLIITPSAFALKAMTNTNMKAATGQAGVSIALDDVTVWQSVGQTLYTDTDGLAETAADAASISISGKETLTTYRAIFDDTNRDGFLSREYGSILGRSAGLQADAVASEYAAYVAGGGADDQTTWEGTGSNLADAQALAKGDIEIAALSIDVAHKVEALSYGMAYNHRNDAATASAGLATFDAAYVTGGGAVGDAGYDAAAATALGAEAFGVAQAFNASGLTSFEFMQSAISVAGVVIGLPTLEIAKTGDTQTIGIVSAGSNNSDDAYIQITKSNSVMAVLGGTIEICPH